MTNIRYGEDILGGLCDPGRRLVFVDDSGTPGKPLPNLARDFVVMCGICMTSERYQVAKAQLSAALADLGSDFTEFHATEIVNPRSNSPWKRIPSEERIRSLSLLVNVLAESVESILFCYVSGEQYYADLQPRILAVEGPKMSHKAALQQGFFQGIIDYLRPAEQMCSGQREVAIVLDSTKPLGRDKIELRSLRDPQGF